MKKTIRLVCLLMVLAVACTFIFAACKPEVENCGDGNHKDANHDGVCDVCGQTGLVVIHTGGVATCKKKAVCSVCGQEYGELAAHTWDTTTDCQHHPKCLVCGTESTGFGAHKDKNYDNICDVCSTPLSYTYRLAANSLPTSWNVHTYQSNDATYVLDYTEDGLYTFDYNEDKTGYKWALAMAADWPQDVSSNYVDAKWGIEAGNTWRAIRIKLRDDLKFDNGDPITAQTFSDSLQLLLNPQAANYRADSYYGGQFSIVGAEKYVKQNSDTYEDVTGGEGVYLDEDWDSLSEGRQKELYFVPDDCFVGAYLKEEGYLAPDGRYEDAAQAFANMFGDSGASGKITTSSTRALIGKSLYELKQDTDAWFIIQTFLDSWCTEEGEEFGFFCTKQHWDVFDWNDVGVKVINDTTIDFIIEKSLSGFYLTYSLAGSMSLVHPDTYEACESESQGAYTNNYGTSVDTYVGFGPYKLTQFVSGNILKFERNPYWYGYKDAANSDESLYQTTGIEIRQTSDANTRLQLFLTGQTDSYGLQATDMADYQSSKYTYYTEGDSTWFIALNPDLAGLTSAQKSATPSAPGKVVNKTVLTVKEFRMALSFSVDRAAYELALDPTGSVAKALYGNMIVSDPDNGVTYRSTQQAKEVICKFWGIDPETDIGPGKEFEDIDEAIASITGYDLAGAKTLFNQAYDIAVERELIDPATNWEVQIVIGQPGSGSVAYYNDGYELLKKVWTDAVVGTKFEGRLVITQSQPLGSTSFSNYLKNNTVDVLFGVGWTGSALDPYSLMEAYVAPNYQYDPGWDTTATTLDIEINGQVLRASVFDWGKNALQGKAINATVIENGEPTSEKVQISAGTDADPEVRLNILAAVEGAVLEQYDMIPVGAEASASLKGMRIKFYTEEYVYGMGRGGLRYMTYTMTDSEWTSYVSAQGGTLNYK